MRSSMAIDAGNFAAAQTSINAIEQIDKDSSYARELRLQLLEKQGRGVESLRLLDAYVTKHPDDASALNERCWAKTTLNLQLNTAIADCDASLKLVPANAATLDSRALAHLRLGQIKDALADYDAALRLSPMLPASLYGRAIARAQTGDDSGALADLAQARKLNPAIDARFTGFGIALPASLEAVKTERKSAGEATK